MGASITTQDAVITNLVGQLKVKDQQGNIRSVTIGDVIRAGEQLIFTPQVQFNLEYQDGTLASQASLLTSEAPQPIQISVNDSSGNEIDAEIAAFQTKILAGEDPTEALPDTAAGDAQANQGNFYFVALSRTGGETLANSGWDTAGVEQPIFTTAETTLPTEELPEPTEEIQFAQPRVASASFSIFEANLPQGSDPSSILTQLASNIQTYAEAGIDSLVINGTSIISNGQFNGPIVVNTPNGVLTIHGFDNSTGQFIYEYVLNSSADHSSSDQLQFLFNIELTDLAGNTASGLLTLNIIDDQPTGFEDSNSLSENQTNLAVGNLLDNDTLGADNASISSITNSQGDTISFSGTTFSDTKIIQGEFGALTLSNNGDYSYQLNHLSAAAQALAQGSQAIETFNYLLTDNDGDSTLVPFTITITGTNNNPVITIPPSGTPTNGYDAGTVIEAGNLDDGTVVNGIPQVSGALEATDVDSGAILTWSGNASGSYGSFVIDPATGKWSYNLDNDLADHLAENTSVTETFLVTVIDEFGGADTHQVVITIQGTNDSPVITSTQADATGAVTEYQEDSTTQIGSQTATGILTAIDVDTGATLTWSANANSAYGSFTIDPVTGQWSYNLDNTAANKLAQGQQIVEQFLVTVTDEFDAIDTQLVTITITGTNDNPVITIPPSGTPTNGYDSGLVIEAGNLDDGTVVNGVPQVSGTLEATDVDNGAKLTWSGNAAGSYGSFVIDPNTGKWSYNLDNDLADSLAENTSVTETFLVTVIDELGGTDTHQVTITIQGTNDSPVITSTQADATGAIVEYQEDSTTQLGSQTATGTLTAIDVDTGATLTWSGSANSAYGSFTIDPTTGQWSYNLDNAAANKLAQGQQVVEQFLVTVTDEFDAIDTQLVTITITGTNDAPSITGGTTVGAVKEAGVIDGGNMLEPGILSTGGTLTASDMDNGAILSWDFIAQTNNYGTFSINASSGEWTYLLDNGLADKLAQGTTHDETFLVKVTDEYGASSEQLVTITITGTNDIPLLTLNDAEGSITEDTNISNGMISDSGSISFSDVDNGSSLTLSASHDGGNIIWHKNGDSDEIIDDFSALATALKAGFSVDANNGNWHYDLDNSLIQFLDIGESITLNFDVTVTDEHGAYNTKTVAITINGKEDRIEWEFSKEIWVPASLAQMVDPYVNGYPLNIPVPIDVDTTDDLSISTLSLAFTNVNGATELGQVWYLDDSSGNPLQYDFSHPVALSTTELSTLVYIPGDNQNTNGQVDISLTFSVTSGGETINGDFVIHTVPANQAENSVTISGEKKESLTSGRNVTAAFIVSNNFADALNTQPENGSLELFTDFQKNENTVPIPESERGIDTITGRERETEVSVHLTVNGMTFIVLLADDPSAIEQSWFYDDETGLMKADINYSDIVWEDNPSVSLVDYLTLNPVASGNVWTITYRDNDGGPYQARFVQASFTHDLLPDNAITVTGSDDTNHLIFGTTEDDALTGANLDDEIYGREGNDFISGLDGDDSLIGGSGNDTISGGAGNDILVGGIGNDILNAGIGSDILYGGAGNDKLDVGDDNEIDTLVWDASSADGCVDIVYNFDLGEDTLDISDILAGVSADATLLDDYLDFSFVDYDDGNGTNGIIDTVITIDTNGSAAGGETVTIVLNNVNVNQGSDDIAVINHLLSNNSLITDTIP